MFRVADLMPAISYMEANLTEKIDLGMIGAASHYSKYYLHRQFSQAFGITVHTYLHRRQLTEAARSLAFTDRPIVSIALTSGYGSQQAFHQAFTALYKATPGRFRDRGRFYPLQLSYEACDRPLPPRKPGRWEVDVATQDDIADWRSLLPLVVDGFPYLSQDEHLAAVRCRIAAGEALIVRDQGVLVGALLFSREAASIDFMGIHPLYRRELSEAFLNRVKDELPPGSPISTTTYRAGDKADPGMRKQLVALGFTGAELLTEFGYPTQQFVLSGTDANEQS